MELSEKFGGRFELLRRVGQGAIGDVWEGLDIDTGRRVAVKVLTEYSASDGQILERFAREKRILERLESPHICRAITNGATSSGVPFLVFEFLDGETLEASLARERSFLVSELQWILEDVLSGLEVAHREHVVHRDLKPANVFLQRAPQARAKILDFGTAKLLSAKDEKLTEQHELVGSLSYMAPEQLATGGEIDGRADLYGVGTIGFQCLTGRLPFAERGPAALLVMKEQENAPSLAEVTRRPWAPEIEAFFARALARSPEHRFQSATEMRLAWSEVADEIPTVRLALPPQEAPRNG